MKKIRELSPTAIRIQDDLKGWIKEQSKRNCRSMSSEIVFILEKYRSEQELKNA